MNIHLGSKYVAGYHPLKSDLSSVEAKNYITHCAITVTTHTSDPKWAEAVGYKVFNPADLAKIIDLSEFEVRDQCLFCPITTLKIVLMVKDQSLFITFGAKDSYQSEIDPENHTEIGSRQYYQIKANLLGYLPDVYTKASKFVEQLKNSKLLDGYNAECVGQSFGGSIAQFVGLKQEIPTTIFNSLAIGSGLQKEISDERLAKADWLLTHLSVAGDFVSDNSLLNTLDYIASTIGIRTPGNFGIGKTLPSAYDDPGSTHGLVLGSLLVHAGFRDVKSPEELKATLESLVL